MSSFKEFKLLPLTPYFFSAYLMNLFYRLWLLLPVKHPSVHTFLKYDFFAASPETFLFIAIMKLPMLIFDGLTCMAIYKVVRFYSSKNEALLAAWLWLFNPYLTIAIETGGTLEVISTFFTIISLYFFIKRKFVLSGISLLVGFVSRYWPLVLIPFYILILVKRKENLTILFKVILAFIIPLVIFISLFMFKPLTTLKNLLNFPVIYDQFRWFLGFKISSFDWQVSIGVVSLLYLLQVFLTFKFWNPPLKIVLDVSFLILLYYISYAYWNPYYPVWLTPLTIIDYVLNRSKHGKIEYTTLFIMFWIGLSLFSFSLLSGALFNIYPYSGWPLKLDEALKEFGARETSSLLIPTFGRSILAGVALIYFLKVNLRNLNSTILQKIRLLRKYF